MESASRAEYPIQRRRMAGSAWREGGREGGREGVIGMYMENEGGREGGGGGSNLYLTELRDADEVPFGAVLARAGVDEWVIDS